MNIAEVCAVLEQVDQDRINATIAELKEIRERGRLFVIGNGGGAGHASHAVCDFRKIGGIEAYAYDNISELTARINDDGWENNVVAWMDASRFNMDDALLVFSVGGGNEQVSVNLHRAIRHAVYDHCATVLGISGADGGTLEKYATVNILIPSTSTPIVEGIQAVLWHLLVTAL